MDASTCPLLLQVLNQLGMRDAFDAVYGASAGALNATYFLSGQLDGVRCVLAKAAVGRLSRTWRPVRPAGRRQVGAYAVPVRAACTEAPTRACLLSLLLCSSSLPPQHLS